METPTTPRPKFFTVPVDLVKTFKTDIRTIPNNLPHNGYIIFDRAMLAEILRGNDAEARHALAAQIDKLGAAGGELLIVAE